MARKKVRLAWIASDSARRACFRKRREGIFKKVMELSTLCGVEAAIAVFCPDEEAAFWPSKSSVEELFRRYEEIPAMERSKKMLNQETFMKDRIAKIKEQTKKCLKKSQEMEMNDLIHKIVSDNRIDELPISDLTNLLASLEEKHREILRRAKHLQELPPLSGNVSVSSSSTAAVNLAPSVPISAITATITECPKGIINITEEGMRLPFTGAGSTRLISPHRNGHELPGSIDLIGPRPAAHQNHMGLPTVSNASWITDLLIMAGNQLGRPYDSWGNETGKYTTHVSVGGDNEAAGGDAVGLMVENEMEEQQLLSYAYGGDVVPALPSLPSTSTTATAQKIMGLQPQKNIATSSTSSGNNIRGHQYDDVNYDAWFESLGV